MALIKLDAESAIRSQNRQRKWPTISGGTGEILRPIARPFYDPKVKVEKGDRLFAMGSCFARQLEDACPDWLNISKTNHFNSRSQNKYNLGSVLNQIKWAYGLDNIENSFSGILESGPNSYNDCHAHTFVSDHSEDFDFSTLPLAPDGSYLDWMKEGTKDQCIRSREKLNVIFKQMRSANVIIITLGLAEIWLDLDTNLPLNETPNRHTINKYPNRFEFQQLDFNDIMGCFDEIYDIFQTQKDGNFKLLLTVSPIPYTTTFSPSAGAISGNCYSKSVQRAAIESFMTKHDNVGYFPSYEMALYSDNAYVWDHDFIHVTAKFAKYILYHALNSILSDELIAKYPDVGTLSVDQNMLELFPEMGLSDLLRPYIRSSHEVKRLKNMIADLTEKVELEVSSINQSTAESLREKDEAIETLSEEIERLVKDKNDLLVEKLKLEIDANNTPSGLD